jgi:adenylosuccinate lyase
MILAGSRLQNRQLADRLQSLAKQLSRARMVGRLFGQPASLASCLRIRRQFHDSTDRVDTALESAVTLIYTVNG